MKDSLTPFLQRLRINLEEQGAIALQMSVDHARDMAKKDHAYQDQTGGLTASTISRPVKKNGSILIGEIANTSQLALYFHEGTGLYGPSKKKYKILPRNKKALAFELPNGQLIITKKVMHPGIKPDPFILRALHNTRPWFLKKLQGAVNRAIRLSIKK